MWGLVKRFVIRVGFVVGLLNGVIGAAGVPGDIATWVEWIGHIMTNPLVLQLASYAVDVAQFVNQVWVRVALVVVGVLMIIWPARWFWRVRHRIKFRWRRLMADQVWIKREEALALIRESAWGRLMSPTITKTVRTKSPFENLVPSWGATESEEIVSGLSEAQKSELKFSAYLELTLDQFTQDNPLAATMREDGEHMIDESMLRAFLRKAMQRKASEEFGPAPSVKL